MADLSSLAGTTTRVTVIDTAGRAFRGRIEEVTSSVLSLQIGREIRRFPVETVASVRARRDDGLLNGVLIGAGVSGGLASLMFLDNECRDDPVCYEATAVYAGTGALAGLAIDALVHRTDLVYSAAGLKAARWVGPLPLIARGGLGVQLRVMF